MLCYPVPRAGNRGAVEDAHVLGDAIYMSPYFVGVSKDTIWVFLYLSPFGSVVHIFNDLPRGEGHLYISLSLILHHECPPANLLRPENLPLEHLNNPFGYTPRKTSMPNSTDEKGTEQVCP